MAKEKIEDSFGNEEPYEMLTPVLPGGMSLSSYDVAHKEYTELANSPTEVGSTAKAEEMNLSIEDVPSEWTLAPELFLALVQVLAPAQSPSEFCAAVNHNLKIAQEICGPMCHDYAFAMFYKNGTDADSVTKEGWEFLADVYADYADLISKR